MTQSSERLVQGHQDNVTALTEAQLSAAPDYRFFSVLLSPIYYRNSPVLQEPVILLLLLGVPYVDINSAIPLEATIRLAFRHRIGQVIDRLSTDRRAAF